MRRLNNLLDEQRAFYDTRAAEWHRWVTAYMAPVRDEFTALLAGRFAGADVVELAAGTGYWTALISPGARSVIALDASPAMLRILDARELPGVTTREQDLFDWQPDKAICDLVFAAHWTSHIPDQCLPAFFGQLDTALRPRGRALLVDVTAAETPWLGESWQEDTDGQEVSLSIRRLDNGTKATVIKEFRPPDRFLATAADHGWPGASHPVGASQGRGFVLYDLRRWDTL